MIRSMPEDALHVVVVAAYPAVRAGLRALLAGGEGIAVVGELTPAALAESAWVDGADALVIDLDDEAASLFPVLNELLPRMPVVLIAIDPAGYRLSTGDTEAPRAYLLRHAGADELI